MALQIICIIACYVIQIMSISSYIMYTEQEYFVIDKPDRWVRRMRD